ncbi:MAG: hypothetical protein HPY76_14265 [Anaerolineae bacterium]|nr:hypothetical protein [Anaerolineae bacterium]
MTTQRFNPRTDTLINRADFLSLLNTAILTGSHRFCRQVAAQWLATYPGDLMVAYLQAKSNLDEGQKDNAKNALTAITKKDPEFVDAQYALALCLAEEDDERFNHVLGCAYAIGKDAIDSSVLPAWAIQLRYCRIAIDQASYEEAEKMIMPILAMNLDNPLPAIFHTRIARVRQDNIGVMRLAEYYANLWDDAIFFKLVLAEVKMALGEEASSIQLLHHCVSRDSAAQVATRLWGRNHKYKPLWQETFSIPFDVPIPADVSAAMGWNRLTVGTPTVAASEPVTEAVEEPSSNDETNVAVDDAAQLTSEASTPDIALVDIEEEITNEAPPVVEEQKGIDETPQQAATDHPIKEPRVKNGEVPFVKDGRKKSSKGEKDSDSVIQSIEEAFQALSQRVNRPALTRVDARFPMYVILSTWKGLVDQYGTQTAGVIKQDMASLADEIKKLTGWGAMVYLPDDDENLQRYGIQAIETNDPWKIKLAITDLDKSLAKKGAMIGCILIVGNSKVVPFHRLPNPTDDSDEDVLSDNPYASTDSNYFIPDWPVGRVPGENGKDAGLLLKQLRQIINYHAQNKTSLPWWRVWLLRSGWFDNLKKYVKEKYIKGLSPSFGYSAAVWRRSSLAVYRTIGEGGSLSISPPEASGNIRPDKLLLTEFGYYNLHGLIDSAEWYGQKDYSDRSAGPDYPIALRTEDLIQNGSSPTVVFSEACYGAHVEDKLEKESIALRFLGIGVQGFVGSTGISYGSVNSPLIAGDLLASLFWKALKDVTTVGEAYMLAKLRLVQEMIKRQGFLDGEDQKTLISFVLYGDPLAGADGYRKKAKEVPRPKVHPTVKTICDRVDSDTAPRVISKEKLREVKRYVEDYLPGLEDSEVMIAQEHTHCDGKHHSCPTAQLGSKMLDDDLTNRVVVTIRKEKKVAQRTHEHYARATLDKDGKVIKLAVSR